MIDLRGLGVGIALALVPEHALDLAAGKLHLAKHRAVQAMATFALLGRVPLFHAGAAVSAGNQADRHAGLLDQGHRERQAQTGTLGALLVLLGRPCRPILGISRMHRVGRVDQPVQRLFGSWPTCRPCPGS